MANLDIDSVIVDRADPERVAAFWSELLGRPIRGRTGIESLGGRRLDEYASGGFLVMADPEGNEFCVIPSAPFELDDEGRTRYLEGENPSARP